MQVVNPTLSICRAIALLTKIYVNFVQSINSLTVPDIVLKLDKLIDSRKEECKVHNPALSSVCRAIAL